MFVFLSCICRKLVFPSPFSPRCKTDTGCHEEDKPVSHHARVDHLSGGHIYIPPPATQGWMHFSHRGSVTRTSLWWPVVTALQPRPHYRAQSGSFASASAAGPCIVNLTGKKKKKKVTLYPMAAKRLRRVPLILPGSRRRKRWTWLDFSEKTNNILYFALFMTERFNAVQAALFCVVGCYLFCSFVV